jgi:hypothetical protein
MTSVRVHELARELGITSKDVMVKLAEIGEFVKSASSVLEPVVVAKLRQSCGRPKAPPNRRPRLANNPFGVDPTYVPRPRDIGQAGPRPSPHVVHPSSPHARKPRREWWKGDQPSDLTRAILDHTVITSRPPDDPIPSGRYYLDEVHAAQREAALWGPTTLDTGLTPAQVAAWIRLHPGATPSLVTEFATNGMIAEDAALRLWYGALRPDRRTLYRQVVDGVVTVEQAAAQVQSFRRNSPEPEAS